MLALQQQLLLGKVLAADGAGLQAGAGPAVRVAVLPLAVEPGRGGTAPHAPHTPGQREGVNAAGQTAHLPRRSKKDKRQLLNN